MRITKLVICNYRSIRHLQMVCQAMVTRLGSNNHGKSNILSALEFASSTSSKPSADGFCIHGDDDELWVEVTFSELTEQEAETFERYLATDGSVCIRKTCRIQGDKLEVARAIASEAYHRFLGFAVGKSQNRLMLNIL